MFSSSLAHLLPLLLFLLGAGWKVATWLAEYPVPAYYMFYLKIRKFFFESLGNSTIKRTKVEVGSNGVPSLKKSLSSCRCTDFLFCLFDFLSFDSLSFLNNTDKLNGPRYLDVAHIDLRSRS